MMVEGDATRSVEMSIGINATAEEVWAAIATAEGLMNWFPLTARVEPGVGGKVWSSWGSELEEEGRITVWEPGERLCIEYPQMGADATVTTDEDRWAGALVATDFVIEKGSGETVLRLVHSGFGAEAKWDSLYDGTRRGWEMVLRGLRHSLERHPGATRRVVNKSVQFDCSIEEAWARATGAAGLCRDGSLDGIVEGDPFEVVAATGDPMCGVVQILEVHRVVALVVEEWNGALFRLHLEEWGEGEEMKRMAYMDISTFGMDEERFGALEEGWTAWLTGVFGEG